MPFEIRITHDASRQLMSMPVRDRNTLRTAIAERLRHKPTVPTRAIKVLRPNRTATYELRIGDLRALYDVEGAEVVIKIIGTKVGNTLIVEGEVFGGLRDDTAEPSGNEPSDNAG
jgi:mRNA-degrading endonuclease RelE of RelBE toxin-antitoxin system